MLEITRFTNPPAPQMGTGRLNPTWKRILHFHSQAVAKLSPLVSNASGKIFDKVDSVAASILRREVELLNEHPNVAMLLSQTTVLKMAGVLFFEANEQARQWRLVVVALFEVLP
jgi:hypothetical protein